MHTHTYTYIRIHIWYTYLDTTISCGAALPLIGSISTRRSWRATQHNGKRGHCAPCRCDRVLLDAVSSCSGIGWMSFVRYCHRCCADLCLTHPLPTKSMGTRQATSPPKNAKRAVVVVYHSMSYYIIVDMYMYIYIYIYISLLYNIILYYMCYIYIERER